MTPAEKKASELALRNAPSGICECRGPDDGSCERCKSVYDFLAGFRAALELDEVKWMEEALKFYALSGRDKYGQLYNKVPSAEDKSRLVFGQVSIGIEAREALTAWRSFRREK